MRVNRLPRAVVGVLASLAALAAVTGAVELLKPHIPVLSLTVLYLFAVLPIAVLWWTWFGIAVAVVSIRRPVFR
jgi:K+-sensing histidine kinase KdpD